MPPKQTLPLDGITVVALEQAVAAPYCTSRLADMGARVIKVERAEGDFARAYDTAVNGDSSYFVWINRGKQSISLDLKTPDDLALMKRMISKADVFVQNLAPGAVERLGLGLAALREKFPRLITCDISGYGSSGPAHELKAYDLLVQAESGLVAVSGPPGPWGRIGVSLCDIGAGMNALIGIQQALMQREKTGNGGPVEVSLFGTAAELMAVPYLQTRYGNNPPERIGLKHPSVAPYGSFRCGDEKDVVISIQNQREWHAFCKIFMQDEAFGTDEQFHSNPARCQNRQALDKAIGDRFAALTRQEAVALLNEANIAFGSINSVEDLIEHPQFVTTAMPVGGEMVELPAVPYHTDSEPTQFKATPELDQHGAAIRAEFDKD